MRPRISSMIALVCGQITLSPEAGAQAATPFDSMAVVRAIEASLEAEVKSFEGRDCVAALSFYGDVEPLFVVSGRATPRREDLAGACPRMVARIPPGASRPVASQVVHALGPSVGYSVTEFLLPGGPGASGSPRSQFLTKIWQLRESQWLIVHVHESLAPA